MRCCRRTCTRRSAGSFQRRSIRRRPALTSSCAWLMAANSCTHLMRTQRTIPRVACTSAAFPCLFLRILHDKILSVFDAAHPDRNLFATNRMACRTESSPKVQCACLLAAWCYLPERQDTLSFRMRSVSCISSSPGTGVESYSRNAVKCAGSSLQLLFLDCPSLAAFVLCSRISGCDWQAPAAWLHLLPKAVFLVNES